MDKSVVNDASTTNNPRSRSKPKEETMKLLKLLEDGQSEVFPGFGCSVQGFLNQVNQIRFSMKDVPDCCMNDLLKILIRSFPKGNKLEQFNNMEKVYELFHAQTLMHDFKSQCGDAESSKQVDELLLAQVLMSDLKLCEGDHAESSTQVPSGASGQEILSSSIEGGPKPTDAAKSGNGNGKGKGKGKRKGKGKGKKA